METELHRAHRQRPRDGRLSSERSDGTDEESEAEITSGRRAIASRKRRASSA
jgi:hypothetical protein